ncbi:hypothetical protein [Thermococcus sp.]
MWREQLEKRGYLENSEILIELTIGGECGEYLPSLALYDKKEDTWYYFDNDIPPGMTQEEALRNAIEFFEKVVVGLEKPKLKISPIREAPEEVYEKFEKFLQGLRDEGED